jgi:hypothetical protein
VVNSFRGLDAYNLVPVAMVISDGYKVIWKQQSCNLKFIMFHTGRLASLFFALLKSNSILYTVNADSRSWSPRNNWSTGQVTLYQGFICLDTDYPEVFVLFLSYSGFMPK